jgi:hypothetical protein
VRSYYKEIILILFILVSCFDRKNKNGKRKPMGKGISPRNGKNTFSDVSKDLKGWSFFSL